MWPCLRSWEEDKASEKTHTVRNMGLLNMLCAVRHPGPTESLETLKILEYLIIYDDFVK